MIGRALFLLLSLTCCTHKDEPRVDVALAGETMGSTWHVKLSVPESKRARAEALQTSIDATLERINDEMSTYRPNSELSKWNASTSIAPVPLSAELAKVMAAAIDVGQKTDGAFDVTMDPLIDLWGFDRSGRKPTLPSAEQIADAKTHVGLDKIALADGALAKKSGDVKVNLGGIAAGFAVDVLAEEITRAGFTDWMIEVTGEVRAHGKNSRGTAWNIGIKRPELTPDVTNLLAAVALVDKAVTTSGSYHNFFEIDGKRYSHILDPKTGAPVQTDLVSVTVLYDDALTADAFDTAFIIVGEERARAIIAAHPGMEAFFVHQKQDGSFFTTKTAGFPAQEPTP